MKPIVENEVNHIVKYSEYFVSYNTLFPSIPLVPFNNAFIYFDYSDPIK